MDNEELISEVLKKHLGAVRDAGFSLQPGLQPRSGRRLKPPLQAKARATLVWVAGFVTVVLVALVSWGGQNRIRSADPAAVRGWVKARTGETFALRNGAAPEGVRLTGAYVTGAAAVVTFAVAGRPGTVRMVPNAVGRHRYLVEAASAGDEKLACMLCHGTEVN